MAESSHTCAWPRRSRNRHSNYRAIMRLITARYLHDIEVTQIARPTRTKQQCCRDGAFNLVIPSHITASHVQLQDGLTMAGLTTASNLAPNWVESGSSMVLTPVPSPQKRCRRGAARRAWHAAQGRGRLRSFKTDQCAPQRPSVPARHPDLHPRHKCRAERMNEAVWPTALTWPVNFEVDAITRPLGT